MADFTGDWFEQLGGRDFDEELGQQVPVCFLDVHLFLEVQGLSPVDELTWDGESCSDLLNSGYGVGTAEGDS
ncbi:hypothetical protein ACTU45_33300 [Streptomyces sp. 24-1644]|uniref:hypothetical protein n=1 Tax=Streptomyces sp. 24-1644 TaxID=3457315 RepID=UPI003FA73330